MGSWFRPKKDGCRAAESRIQDRLNSCSALSAGEYLAAASEELRGHLERCAKCRTVMEEALAVRQLLRGHVAAAEDPGAAFTARVMRGVAAEAARNAPAANPWSAVPVLAARMAWVSAIVLLLATTWLYEKHPWRADKSPSVEFAGASLEPAPQPADRDEALASLAGREP